jgi:hypothetical protein
MIGFHSGALSVDENASHREIRVEQKDIRSFPHLEAADLVTPSSDGRGRKGSHTYGSGEVDASLSMHMPNHEVHAAYAAGQALRIRKQADGSITVERFSAVERAKNVHPRWPIQRTIAIRH